MHRYNTYVLLGIVIALMVYAPFVHSAEVLEEVSYEDLTPAEQKAFDEMFSQTGVLTTGVTSATTTDIDTQQLVSCFDYYTFNSVQTAFVPTVQATLAGTMIDFSGTITNENPYPVVNGRLYAKVYRLRESLEKNQNGNHLVDRFVISENVTIPANSQKDITFAWNVPAWAMDGTYEIATFFVTENKYNLLGLSFTDDILGNSATFDVKAQTSDAVMFNKDTVTVNDVGYLFAGFPPRVNEIEPVTIIATLENKSKKTVEIPVIAHVYTWDSMHPDNYIETINQTITIPAGKTAPVKIMVDNTGEPVYFVEIISQYRDAKSILNLRFVRDGVNKLRINFPSAYTYPLEKGKPATVFSCVHNTADSGALGTLRLQVFDVIGNLLDSKEYTGIITGEMKALASTFTPKQSYESFRVRAELEQDGKTVTADDVWYRCDELGSCAVATQPTWWDTVRDVFEMHKVFILSVLGGSALLLLLVILYLWRSSKKVISTNI